VGLDRVQVATERSLSSTSCSDVAPFASLASSNAHTKVYAYVILPSKLTISVEFYFVDRGHQSSSVLLCTASNDNTRCQARIILRSEETREAGRVTRLHHDSHEGPLCLAVRDESCV
jgi:hypothetical protein